MADTDLTVVGNRTGDAEALQTNTDSLSSVSSILHALLNGDGGTADVCPLSVLEADALRVLTHLVRIYTCLVTNLVGFFNAVDAILLQSSKNLVNTALLTLKLYFSYHRNNRFLILNLQSVNLSILNYSLRGSIAFTAPCSLVVRP